MSLVVKLLLLFVGVFFVNVCVVVTLSSVHALTMPVVILLILEMVGVLFYLTYKYVLKNLGELYVALKDIDFNQDTIDLSKVDSLTVSGFKELNLIIKKFQYLMDIIAERINRVNKATWKSEHDKLTDCYNRMALDRNKHSYEVADNFAIVFIDVNNLKRMNDEFGHEAGDSLITRAAEKLHFWDQYGDVYRTGGDEFMIVVKNYPRNLVQKIFDQWYPTVGILNKESDGFKCVLSYGIAFGERGDSFDLKEKEADDKMYEFKVAIKKKFGEPMR